jgi:hypothetical protein
VEYPDRNTIRLAGGRGWIWAGYQPAAILGAWRLEAGELVATLSRPADADLYWLRQPPLVLEVVTYRRRPGGVTAKRHTTLAIRGVTVSSDRRELRGLVGARLGGSWQ